MLHKTVVLAVMLASGSSALSPPIPAYAGDPRRTERLDSLLGREVSTRPEGDGGRIVDLLIDAHGQLSAAVVEFGGFLGIGTRKIAVEWSAFHVQNGGIVVDVTRNQLRAAKEYKPSEPTNVVKSACD